MNLTWRYVRSTIFKILAIDIFYYQNFKRQTMIIFLKFFLFRRTKSKNTQFYLENFVFNIKFQN